MAVYKISCLAFTCQFHDHTNFIILNWIVPMESSSLIPGKKGKKTSDFHLRIFFFAIDIIA